MKILYISASTFPSRNANSVHVVKMSNAFNQIGHDCTLIAKADPQNPIATDRLLQDYSVARVFPVRLLTQMSVKGSQYLYSFQAARVVQQSSPDLVFSRDLIGAYLACCLGQKVFFESHAPIEQNSSKMISLIKRALFKRLTRHKNFQKLVVITESLRVFYEDQYHLSREEILVCPDGADPIERDVPAHQNIPSQSGRPQVGYVGHLYPGKGMEVISQCAKLCPEADFHIVGGTDTDLTYWKEVCGQDSNVTFHGFRPHNETASYLKAFDMVLLPNQKKVQIGTKSGSEIGAWTSPLKLFEYMSAGKVILASDLPVLKEVLNDRQNAYLCDPERPQDWADAIRHLWAAPQTRSLLADQAFRDFTELYSWEKRAEIILKALSPS